MQPENILYAFVNVYVNNKSVTSIAAELRYSRNTIGNYKKKFNLQKEIIDFILENPELQNASPKQLRKAPAAKIFLDKHFIRSYRREKTHETHMAIKEYCDAHLNYCIFKRSKYEFACKQLNRYSEKLYEEYSYDMDYRFVRRGGILQLENHREECIEMIKQHLVNYPGFSSCNYEQLNFRNQEGFALYMKSITTIRSYLRQPQKIPRNYKEVYELFKESEYCKTTPISYSTFYKIACQFWGEEKLVYNFFEDLKCDDGDNEKRKTVKT